MSEPITYEEALLRENAVLRAAITALADHLGVELAGFGESPFARGGQFISATAAQATAQAREFTSAAVGVIAAALDQRTAALVADAVREAGQALAPVVHVTNEVSVTSGNRSIEFYRGADGQIAGALAEGEPTITTSTTGATVGGGAG